MMKVLLFALAIIASGRAKQGFGPGGQDWGFSTVREGTHIFWWLYETQADVSDISQRPLIIWLQGGPGISASGYGNFEIIGPLDSELNPRDSSWVKDFNVLFVDNPVGAGFSYLNATTSQGYAKSNAEVANDFVVFLSDFYDVHPEFSRTPLYIVGQGYGGKFAVDITLKIWDEQQAGNLKSNISGVALGNSFVDPLTIAQYQAQYLYQVGLIDDAVNDQVFNYGIFIKNQYDSGEYHTATYEFSRMRNIISRQTDGVDFDNMLTKNVRPSSKSNAYNGMMVDNARDSVYINTLMNGPVREALSIPEESVFGANTGSVFNYLWDDVMTPVTNGVEEILNRTTLVVEVYSGNLDVTSNTAGQLAWTNNLRWNRESEFRNTLRESIWENDVLEGYRRYGGNFAFNWVNAAGHDVPAENPGAMRAILRHLTHV